MLDQIDVAWTVAREVASVRPLALLSDGSVTRVRARLSDIAREVRRARVRRSGNISRAMKRGAAFPCPARGEVTHARIHLTRSINEIRKTSTVFLRPVKGSRHLVRGTNIVEIRVRMDESVVDLRRRSPCTSIGRSAHCRECEVRHRATMILPRDYRGRELDRIQFAAIIARRRIHAISKKGVRVRCRNSVRRRVVRVRVLGRRARSTNTNRRERSAGGRVRVEARVEGRIRRVGHVRGVGRESRKISKNVRKR